MPRCADSWCSARRFPRAPARARLAWRFLEHVTQHIAEVLRVLEVLIDRSKADVGDLVQPVQLAHHHLADAARSDLALAKAEQFLSDAVDRGIDIVGGYGPFVLRAGKTDP